MSRSRTTSSSSATTPQEHYSPLVSLSYHAEHPLSENEMTSADSEDEIETQLKDYAFTVNGAGYKLNEIFPTRAEPCKVIAATLDGDICVLFLSRSLPS
jgi:hypothetical protein